MGPVISEGVCLQMRSKRKKSYADQNLEKTTTVEVVTDHAGLEACIEKMQLDQLVA